MKLTALTALCVAFVVTTGASVSAHAAAFAFNGDSKHGSHLRSADAAAIDYAKYAWIGSDDNRPGPVDHIIVSIADQRLYAYHAKTLVAWSNVSSGRTGHETPTGDFEVSQKDADHHSSLYDDASMPYFMRLTDGGVGLHAGFLPGYPASHGCVRLPFGMAHDLFETVQPGTPVEILGGSVNASTAMTTPSVSGVHLAQN